MKKLNKYSLVTAFVVFLVLGLTGPTAMFAAAPTPVDLLSAGNFVILSKSGITNVPASAITGNIGTSPITGAAITGLDCVEVNGTIYTVDATGPACRVTDATLLTTAVLDMEAAYTNAAGRPAGVGPFLNV
ncbi:MAG: ice-binding family protein, partial [Candidatus Hydromicrobium sp.]|nr:ice-binding family protein [Candidatus Hydromicrobium sp.]